LPLSFSGSATPRNKIFVDTTAPTQDTTPPTLTVTNASGNGCVVSATYGPGSQVLGGLINGGLYYTLCPWIRISATAADNYGIVYVQLGDDGGILERQEVPGEKSVSTTFVNTPSLDPYSRSSFTVRTMNIAGVTDEDTFTIQRDRYPSVPPSISASTGGCVLGSGNGTITVTWANATDAQRYDLQINGSTIIRNVTSPYPHSVPATATGAQYTFRVRGVNNLENWDPRPGYGVSEWSDPVTVTGPRLCQPKLLICPESASNININVGSTLSFSTRYWLDLASTPTCSMSGQPVTASWTSSNTSRASIAGGTVTGVAPGTGIIITATYGGASDTQGVTIVATPKLIICPAGPTSITVGGTVALTAKYWSSYNGTPLCSTGNNDAVTFTWSSNNPGQATVVGGSVTGIAAGNPIITASYLGTSATRSVVVNAPTTCLAGWTDGELAFDGWAGSAPGWCSGTSFGACRPVPQGTTGGTQASAKGNINLCCYTNGDNLGWVRTCGAQAPLPSVSLTGPASTGVSVPFMLTWNSANASACSASVLPATGCGSWSGSKALDNSQSVTPTVAGTCDYRITCTNGTDSTVDSTSVTVGGAPGPTPGCWDLKIYGEIVGDPPYQFCDAIEYGTLPRCNTLTPAPVNGDTCSGSVPKCCVTNATTPGNRGYDCSTDPSACSTPPVSTCVISAGVGVEVLEVCATTEVQDFFGIQPIPSCPPAGSTVPSSDYPNGVCLVSIDTSVGGTCWDNYYYRTCGGAPDPTYTLTVNSTGATNVPITSSTGNGGTTNYQRTSMPGNYTAVLTAPALAPNGYIFSSWGVGCTSVAGNTCTITMAGANRTMTVYYSAVPTYALTVRSSGVLGATITSGTGDGGTTEYIRPSKTGSYTATLTAQPVTGYNFTSWTGCTSVAGNTCTITMNNANRIVTANYSPVSTYTLTVSKVGTAYTAGTVVSSPAGISCGADCTELYVSGTAVSLLSSIPFGTVSYSGSCSGTTCNLSMTANRSVTATFSCTGGYVWNGASCVANLPACGTANGGTFPSAPTAGLCTTGTVNWTDNIANDGEYNWNCVTSSSVSCSATKEAAGPCGTWKAVIVNINHSGTCGVPNSPIFYGDPCGPDGTTRWFYNTNVMGRCSSALYECECGTDTLVCKDIEEGGCWLTDGEGGYACDEHGVMDRVPNNFNPCSGTGIRCNARDQYHWASEAYCP
jgi:hypothetical protein